MPALDGLRGLATGLVLWHHAPQVLHADRAVYAHSPWRESAGGWLGVDLFFVVSGFLITSILLRTRGRERYLRTFFGRRILRIFPLAYLYLSVLLTISLAGLNYPELRNPQFALMFYLYMANLFIASHAWPGGALGILWSLAIEEQFYAIWPFITKRARDRTIAVVCLGLIFVAPVFRHFLFARFGRDAVLVVTFCRADALGFGALLALARHSGRFASITSFLQRASLPAVLTIVGTLLVPFGSTPPARLPQYFVAFGYSAIAAAFAILTGAAVEAKGWPYRALTMAPLMWLGTRCYGLYIWHYFVGDAIYTAFRYHVPFRTHFHVQVAIWLVATCLTAQVSWRFFEQPFLRLKRHFA